MRVPQTLKDMTERLSPSPDPSHPPPPTPMGIFKGKYMAVMKMHQIRGQETAAHIHTGKHEWIGVIYGSVKLVMEDTGTETVLNQYDSFHVEPGRPHRILAIEDSLMWCVTVPPDDDYPFPQP